MTAIPAFAITADLAFVPAPQAALATNDNQAARTQSRRRSLVTGLATINGLAAGIAAELYLSGTPVPMSGEQLWRDMCAHLDAGACIGHMARSVAQFAQANQPPIAFAAVIALFFIRGYVARTLTER